MEGATTEGPGYQSMLRALGSYLDEEPSCRISVVEVPDGFLVRMQRTVYKLEPRVELFKRDTLTQHIDQFVRAQLPSGVRQRHQGIWAQFPNGHQDFMRALGYELEGSGARDIVLDELEDGLSLTYTQPAPEGGWEIRSVFLDTDGIEAVLNEAFNRRRHNGLGVEEAPRLLEL